MVRIEKPDPPTVQKVTHYSIELNWDHVKKALHDERLKYNLQEYSNNSKREWITVYSGYGTKALVDNLEPASEYLYRLCVSNAENERSEYSSACTVKTTSMLSVLLFCSVSRGFSKSDRYEIEW